MTRTSARQAVRVDHVSADSADPVEWAGRDLLALRGLHGPRIRRLLQRAGRYAPVANRTETLTGELAGKVVALLSFESSTRTRVSFELSARRLGAAVVDLSGGSSSVAKGESLADTARTIEAMGASVMVVRTRQAGGAAVVANAVSCPVVNAGDGRHEHPTQGLLDAYTLAESFDRLDGFDLSGLRVAIVGDVANSRVARSAIAGFTALGAKVVCTGPIALAPRSFESLGCEVQRDFDAVLGEVDAVMMLRVQFERHAGAANQRDDASVGSLREYRAGYALTAERAARMKPDAIVMHPGPMNIGIEIDAAVARGPRSVIGRQVANGVAVRMAVLAMLCGG
ncbi:MAG: aspartate carbamoyltransferase catalytic subunit [Planctomycetes bacterium]|nr:aspartate carbamoyltransferase catalytic subunit [Planctomycetota bacterium]